jgi:hypothetical protein
VILGEKKTYKSLWRVQNLLFEFRIPSDCSDMSNAQVWKRLFLSLSFLEWKKTGTIGFMHKVYLNR